MRKGSRLHRILSRMYWWYHRRWEEALECKRLRLLRKDLRTPRGKKVYLIGTPTHENLGDSAIVLAQTAFLKQCGLKAEQIHEITDIAYHRDWNHIRKWIPKDGLIAHLGGGHMGNQWPEEELLHRRQVQAFPKNPAVIFPQTLYYLPDEAGKRAAEESIPVYNGKPNLTLAAREKTSYETMKRLYPDTKILLVPDIVLSSSMQAFGAQPQKRQGAILCFRNDLEKAMGEETQGQIKNLLNRRGLAYRMTDMYADQTVTVENRAALVRQKLEELASAELVITDRLHGMVFCAITGTPCMVFRNNNPKVRGTYEWISYLPYIRYVQSLEEVENALPELLAVQNGAFHNQPLQQYYAQLAEVVKQYADS